MTPSATPPTIGTVPHLIEGPPFAHLGLSTVAPSAADVNDPDGSTVALIAETQPVPPDPECDTRRTVPRSRTGRDYQPYPPCL